MTYLQACYKPIKGFFGLAIIMFWAMQVSAQPSGPPPGYKPPPIHSDSLKAVWYDTKLPDTTRLKALKKIIRHKFQSRVPDSTYFYGTQMYELAEKKNLVYWKGNGRFFQSQSFSTRQMYDKAIEYEKMSLEYNLAHGDKEIIGNAYYNLGLIYFSLQELSQAIPQFLQALKNFKASGATDRFDQVNYIIGYCYQEAGDTEKALGYFREALRIRKEGGDREGVAALLSSIAQSYYQMGDTTQAISYNLQSLKAYEEFKTSGGRAVPLTSLATIYYEKEAYEKAIGYCNQSLEVFKYKEIEFPTRGVRLLLGKIYFAQEKYDEALSHLITVQEICQKYPHVTMGQGDYQYLYKTHKALGQNTKALEMYESFIQVRDSSLKDENSQAMMRFEIQSDYDKQKALDDLAFEKQKEQQRLISFSIGLGLILSLIFGAIIFNRLRVTRRQKVEIEAQRGRAERSEKVKEQFLANMSHEIRTPMHAISGMVKILERNDHPKAQAVFLDAMHKSSDNLIVLLNDILDLSKIEAGKLDVENIPMQPEEVLSTVEQILRYKAEEKSLSFSVDIDESVPDWVMGDPTRLNQILTNLAGNAIKFTEKGSVNIFLSKKNDFLLYEVRDTGIGIANEKLHSIFDAFEQAEGSTTRRFGGTGLGLNISRQLVELMGGNIWAESEVGKGSTFFVSLPLVAVEGEVADKQSLSEEQLMEMGAVLSGKRILLAEDNEFNQMIATDDLAYYAKGIQVDIVENGALALEKAKTGLYDLILMDVQMPEMDGVEAALKIREWEQANGRTPIPIIAMTASLLKSEVNLCLEAGMDNYVPKPYEAEELVGRMYEEMIAS